MARTYKVWVEIEVLDDKGDHVHSGGDIGILPDPLGEFTGKGAKQAAINRQAEVAAAFCTDPCSDAVKARKP